MRRIQAVLLTVLLTSLGMPAFGQGTPHQCPHGGATIADLMHCVDHAAMIGHIDGAGIVQSLLAKLDSAQAALNRGQAEVAVSKLYALTNQVEAQAGKHIAANHAPHSLDHIQRVIDALGG